MYKRQAVKDAGPNASPPMVIGVGIGGTYEKCALMAKHALTRNLKEESPVPYVRELEKEMLEKINRLGIGPGYLPWMNKIFFRISLNSFVHCTILFLFCPVEQAV